MIKKALLFIPLVSGIMFLNVAGAAAAEADQLALVGKMNANGTVTLDRQRFQPAFEDGTPVHAVHVHIFDGFAYVVRRGYQGSSCQQQALHLWNAEGKISSSNAANPGSNLWVKTSIVYRLDCEDTGCSNHVTAVGNPPKGVKARCEPPSVSGPCACRFPESAGGELVLVLGACTKTFDQRVLTQLSGWIRKAYIQSE